MGAVTRYGRGDVVKELYMDRSTRTVADLIGPDDQGVWMISRINVPREHRGQGHASNILREILRDADEEGATLELWPYASGANMGGLKQKALEGWYARYGFVKQKKGNMVRAPKND
jgi:predicted GNAT family N-acyltransferase